MSRLSLATSLALSCAPLPLACGQPASHYDRFTPFVIGSEGIELLAAGSATRLRPYVAIADAPNIPADSVRARWSIIPRIPGITIGAATGTVTVASTVPHGTRGQVRAVFPYGQSATVPFYVYSRAANPFIGSWRIDPSMTCTRPMVSGSPHLEVIPRRDWGDSTLRFGADSTFTLGRHPESIRGPAPPVLDGRYLIDSAGRVIRFAQVPRFAGDSTRTDRWSLHVTLDEQKRQLTIAQLPVAPTRESYCVYTFHRLDPT